MSWCITLLISLGKVVHAIYRDFFSSVKFENFIGKILIVLNIFAQNKTYIVGTCLTHNVSFGSKIRKKANPSFSI